MKPFAYSRCSTIDSAIAEASAETGAAFIAGATELTNWMKDGIQSLTRLVDINALPLSDVITNTRRVQLAAATASIQADCTAVVRSGTADLGTGQYTVMTQIAADALGLEPRDVVFELGDTDQAFAFVAGGSSGVRSVGPAVRKAGEAARAKVLELAIADEQSPLAGYGPEAIRAEAGELVLKHAPSQRDRYGRGDCQCRFPRYREADSQATSNDRGLLACLVPSTT